MKKTTLFDLNQTAAAAALNAIGKDALSVASIKLEAFAAAEHDRVDYPVWENFFTGHIQNYTTMQSRLSPATLAAEAAAKAATAPAQ